MDVDIVVDTDGVAVKWTSHTHWRINNVYLILVKFNALVREFFKRDVLVQQF